MRLNPLTLLLAVHILGASACGGVSQDAPAPPTTQLESLSARPKLETLIDSLARVEAYVIVTPSQSWHIEGADGLLGAFPQFGDSAVGPLVGCVADTSFAQTTYDGAPVRKGLMCYAALLFVAYSEGGASGTWAGTIFPTTPPAGLVEAARAWQDAISQGAYKLN